MDTFNLHEWVGNGKKSLLNENRTTISEVRQLDDEDIDRIVNKIGDFATAPKAVGGEDEWDLEQVQVGSCEQHRVAYEGVIRRNKFALKTIFNIVKANDKIKNPFLKTWASLMGYIMSKYPALTTMHRMRDAMWDCGYNPQDIASSILGIDLRDYEGTGPTREGQLDEAEGSMLMQLLNYIAGKD
jgi:hypothetical protein